MTQARVTNIPTDTPPELRRSLELMLQELSTLREELNNALAKIKELEQSKG